MVTGLMMHLPQLPELPTSLPHSPRHVGPARPSQITCFHLRIWGNSNSYRELTPDLLKVWVVGLIQRGHCHSGALEGAVEPERGHSRCLS